MVPKDSIKLTLPLSVTISRKTKEDKIVPLNLNTYRNLHHSTNNQAKVIYADIMGQELVRVGLLDSHPGRVCFPAGPGPFRLTYTLYRANRTSFDVSNVLSIIDKFTLDALVEYRLFSDDNFKVFPEVVYRWGGVDKDHPRAELEIVPL